MRSLIVVGWVGLVLCGAGLLEVRATTAPDALSELRGVMKLELDQSGMASSGSDTNYQKRSTIEQVAQIRTQIARGNSSYALEILSRVGSVFSSAAVGAAVEKAQAQLMREQKERDERRVKTAEDTLRGAMETALKAKTASEMDPLFKMVGDVQTSLNSGGDRSNAVQIEANRVQNGLEFIRRWQDYLFAREAGNAGKAQDLARDMASNSSFNDFVPRSQLLGLAAGGKGPAKIKIVQDQLSPILKRAIALKSAIEVDALLDEVAAIKGGLEADDRGSNYSSINYLNSAASWLQQWQGVLLVAQKGRVNDVKSGLSELQSRGNMLVGMPRGTLLETQERLVVEAQKIWAALPDLDLEAIRKVTTLEEMSALVAAQPAPDGSNNVPRDTPMGTLRQLNQIYLNVKAGLPVFSSVPTGNMMSLPEMVALKAQLELYAVPRVLNLPPTTAPAAGEGPLQFLDRLIAQAKESGQWIQAARAAELLQALGSDTIRPPSDGTAIATRYQQAAENMQKAGQLSLAVYFYNAALQAGGAGMPTQEIGDALAKIKAEHAAEFEEGNKQFLAMGPDAANRMADLMRLQMSFRGNYPYAPYGPTGAAGRPGVAPGIPASSAPSPATSASPALPKRKATH